MNYQIGDVINVRATVTHVLSDGGVAAELSYGERIYPDADEIELVERQLEPGSPVYISGNLLVRGSIIAVHGESAWVNINGEAVTVPVDSLSYAPTWAA